MSLLEIRNLTLEIARTDLAIVKDVSLSVEPGEIVAIVGESGSGKTQVARAVMALNHRAIRRRSGQSLFCGQDIFALSHREKRAIRGSQIGMVFQEPMTSLNPSLTIGRQLLEGLELHRKLTQQERLDKVAEMLRRVGIQDVDHAMRAYPHEFSGGMRQRIMLASVMLLEPALLIADEPTTALDAVIQRDVMELMVDLTRSANTAVLLISHDLPMVARYADRILVMRSGELVEQGAAKDILARPQHDYTRKLLAALSWRGPARDVDRQKTPIIAVERLVVDYGGQQRLFRRSQTKRALKGIDISVQPNEIVAVVGGSGSGKTTLGNVIAGLVPATSGRLFFDGKPVVPGTPGYAEWRTNSQMVFQDPYSSLDPRMKIEALVGEALRHEKRINRQQKRDRVVAMLSEVGLGEQYLDRFPHELSGGQRQRVAIARALICNPRFLIADEPVSALDVTVRAQVLDLFAELQKRHGFSCLFISHDLGVVEQVADRVIVMQHGEIVEQGSRDEVFDRPRHAYTRKLLSAIPALAPAPGGGIEMRWRETAG
ncbi:ABC transporter ATP-binding protein [Cereibacter changlensis]|uniref:ABC transporter ATP-binding protein n=1 Tax=Cereibacter changlensis TaxID=402884 RepID=A0A4V5NM08_9RHOB|nr:ABC transporter ATP-binding protein [Cereibacter changlensis]TKA97707.1 ABC transporter ATP-binding protein [Cereibacter changlensis]